MTKINKINKISITALDNIMKTIDTGVKMVKWNGLDVEIKHTLPFREVLAFVDNVSTSCFSIGNEYLPEVKVFAIKCCVLEMYANFTLPDNVEHKYDLIYNTDAFETVIEHINTKQFNEIVEAINEKVYNSADANVALANKQINDIYTSFEGLQKQINDVFNGLSSDEILGFISAVTNNKLDEEKIVKAYMDNTNSKKDE